MVLQVYLIWKLLYEENANKPKITLETDKGLEEGDTIQVSIKSEIIIDLNKDVKWLQIKDKYKNEFQLENNRFKDMEKTGFIIIMVLEYSIVISFQDKNKKKLFIMKNWKSIPKKLKKLFCWKILTEK